VGGFGGVGLSGAVNCFVLRVSWWGELLYHNNIIIMIAMLSVKYKYE